MSSAQPTPAEGGPRGAVTRARARVVAVALLIAGCAVVAVVAFASRSRAPMLEDDFTGTDHLITNEYAAHRPGDRGAVRSPRWWVSSGSLFRRDGRGWTGRPDGLSPDACSCAANGSAVFRMTSRRHDLRDVALSFALRTVRLTSTERTPPRSWDGVHVILRWQSPQRTYYATVNRRDGGVVIKKKVPGGPANGGTYMDLAPPARVLVPYGREQQIRATVENRGDGSVAIRLYADGRLIARAVDRGVGGTPIRSPGAVGVRGDNAEFELDRLRLSAIG